MKRFSALACVIVALGLGGCYSPSFEDGKLPCSAQGKCPSALHCAVDNLCYHDGHGPGSDGGPIIDAAMSGGDADLIDAVAIDAPLVDGAPPIVFPPAAVWISSGGGGSMSSTSAARLSLSIGGTIVVGTATASGGGSLTFGYLSNLTY